MKISGNQEGIEKLCESNKPLLSPFVNEHEDIYFVSYDGFIYRYKEGNFIPLVEIGGQPNGIIISPLKTAYIADLAHSSILAKSLVNDQEEASFISRDFDGEPFIGPNSLVLSNDGQKLYFTDSGPLGETSIERPAGSVFVMELDDQIIKSICFQKLAHPSGLVLDKSNDILYVCETLRNRILKFYVGEQGNNLCTVFHQFSGRLGPMAIAVNKEDYVFVSHFEYQQFAKEGLISIMSTKGTVLQVLEIPEYPQINGMTFSQNNENILLLTDDSNTPVCIRVMIQSQENEKDNERNDEFNKLNQKKFIKIQFQKNLLK